MKAIRLNSRRSGVGLIAVLVVFFFLSAMTVVAIRDNLARRGKVRVRHDAVVARSLAEAGVHQALHALAAGKSLPVLEGAIGRGRYRVEAKAETAKAGVWQVVAIGVARPDVPTSSRKRITLHVQVTPSGGQSAVKVLSWQEG